MYYDPATGQYGDLNASVNGTNSETTTFYFGETVSSGYNETQAEFLLYSGGLRIISTMDPEIQAIVDAAVSNEENYTDKTDWLLSYALTVMHPDGTSTNYSQEKMVKYFKENVKKDFDLLFSSQEEAMEAVEAYKAGL